MPKCPTCGTNRYKNFTLLEYHNEGESLARCKRCLQAFGVSHEDALNIIERMAER